MAQVKNRWRSQELVGRPVWAVDLHVHAKLTKADPFAPQLITALLKRARKIGLNGLALAEHFHARDFWEIYETLYRSFPCVEGTFRVGEDFFILAGGEVSLYEGHHLVVLAPPEHLFELDRSFPQPLSAGYRPCFPEFLERSRQAVAVVIVAHPFRRHPVLDPVVEFFLPQCQAVELNGRDLNPLPRVLEPARRLGLPVVAGSDAHHPWQLGTRATLLPAGSADFASVAAAINRGETGLAELPAAKWRVGLTANYKRAVKTWRRAIALLRREPEPVTSAGEASRARGEPAPSNPAEVTANYGYGVPQPQAAEASGSRAPVGVSNGNSLY
ncbi:MAG: PHP-associated domain-containing protein [Moorellales bacterium]